MTAPIPQFVDTLAGRTSTAVFITLYKNAAPTIYDGINNQYQVGQRWIDVSVAGRNREYLLKGFVSSNGVVTADWILISSGDAALETLTGNSGGPVETDANNNINTVGTGSITIVGDDPTNTLTTQLTGLTNHSVLVGAGTATITKVAPSATLGIPLVSKGVSADPAFDVASVPGGGTGVANIPAHDLIVGNGTSPVNLLAPSATVGIPVVSQGVSADPVYGTAVVAGGGTGATSFTAYSPITGGTTTTNPFQSASSGQSNSGYVLTSTGASSLPTWQAAASGFRTVNMQVFAADGTYTPTAGMVYCIVEGVGGGGGGGGAATASASQSANAGGGGGGGYVRALYNAATIGVSQAIGIGAGGAGGTAGANNGSTGGNTTIGALVTCNGGGGGTGASSQASATFSGADGGIGSAGSAINYFVCYGSSGGPGFGVNLVSPGINMVIGGYGGSSHWGGSSRVVNLNTTGQTVGTLGLPFGGGGGGGITCNTGTQVAGGAGSNGLVVITEFIQ